MKSHRQLFHSLAYWWLLPDAMSREGTLVPHTELCSELLTFLSCHLGSPRLLSSRVPSLADCCSIHRRTSSFLVLHQSDQPEPLPGSFPEIFAHNSLNEGNLESVCGDMHNQHIKIFTSTRLHQIPQQVCLFQNCTVSTILMPELLVQSLTNYPIQLVTWD